jgi:hypothetical protein
LAKSGKILILFKTSNFTKLNFHDIESGRKGRRKGRGGRGWVAGRGERGKGRGEAVVRKRKEEDGESGKGWEEGEEEGGKRGREVGCEVEMVQGRVEIGGEICSWNTVQNIEYRN